MKKELLTITVAAICAFGFAACGTAVSNGGTSPTAAGNATSSTTSSATQTTDLSKKDINVISREDGSGTRSAFVELFKVLNADKKDATVDTAEITNSTSVMLTTVAQNKASIGYVSLGSLSSDVKAVKIDGVEATVANVKNNTYKISRPFNLIYKESALSPLAADFVKFILSTDGQAIISNDGYIALEAKESYKAAGLKGKITLAGSTSVSPVMGVLVDAYKKLNDGVSIEIQQTGSSAGITSAIQGVCDIGMSSRELTDSEKAQIGSVQMATDGIAVIVNKANGIDQLTSDQVKDIFLGNVTKWGDVK